MMRMFTQPITLPDGTKRIFLHISGAKGARDIYVGMLESELCAMRIVKAVNRDHLFDEMVEALKKINPRISHEYDCTTLETQVELDCSCGLRDIDNLIARAEGKEGI